MSTIDLVRAAILNLQSAAKTQEANEWLVRFAQSQESWEIFDKLLQDPPGPTRTFASVSFYSKIQRDFNQLTQDNINYLLDALIQHLIKYTSESNSIDIRASRYVCLSIAAVTVQIKRNDTVQDILMRINPLVSTSPLVVLELLIALPEECYNQSIDVSDDVRDQFSISLTNSADMVFNFLYHITTSNTIANINKVLTCASRWIEYADISKDMLMAHPLYNVIITSLSKAELFEKAIDALIATWKRFGIQVYDDLIPVTLQLKGLWDNQIQYLSTLYTIPFDPDDVDEDHTNVCRMICLYLTEVCESCMSMYYNDKVTEDTRIKDLLLFIIQCVNFSYDFEIARIPLKVFYDVSMIYDTHKEYHQHDNNRGDVRGVLGGRSQYTQSPTLFLQSIYEELLKVLIHQAVLMDSYLYEKKQMTDTLEDKRLELLDCIGDCTIILSSSKATQILCNLLQHEINDNSSHTTGVNTTTTTLSWGRIEAILFGLQSTVTNLSAQDCDMVLHIITFLHTLPDIQRLKLSSIQLLGKVASFLRVYESRLTEELNYVTPCLNQPKLALASSKTIMNICASCSNLPSFPVDYIFQIHIQRHILNLSPEAESYVLEGLCYLITAMNESAEKQEQALIAVMTPIQTSLQTNILNKTTSLIVKDIDAITTIYRFLFINPTILARIFLIIQPLLEQSLTVTSEERLCEKICRCYKYIMKNLKQELWPYLPALTATFKDNFIKHPYSSFLYAAAICITCYIQANNGAYVSILYDMIWALSDIFFQRMTQLQDFENKPDLVEEYFYFISRALELYPEPVLLSSSAALLVSAGITGLKLQHREAQKGILHFFEKLIESCVKFPSTQSYQLVSQCAEPLVNTVMQSLSGLMPSYALDENNGCIGDVLWNLYELNADQFIIWLQHAIDQLPPPKQDIALKSNLLSSLTQRPSKRHFIRLFVDYDWRCNGSRNDDQNNGIGID